MEKRPTHLRGDLAIGSLCAALLLTIALSGCGTEDASSLTTRDDENSIDVPGRFYNAQALAVTSGHIVSFDIVLSEEGTTGIIGEAFALDSGEIVDIPTPAENTFVVTAAGSLDDQVIVGGVTCKSLVFVDNDPDQCARQTESYMFDPETTSWKQLAVPDGWVSMELVQQGPDGSMIATFGSDEGASQIVGLLGEEGWEPLVERPKGHYATWCSTADYLYRLAGDSAIEAGDGFVLGGDSGAQGDGPATSWGIEQVSFNGEIVELDTPDLNPYYGSTSVQLVCSESGPLLLSTEPSESTILYRHTIDNGWERVGGGLNGGLPSMVADVLSSADGLAAVAWQEVQENAGPDVSRKVSIVAIDGSGSVHELQGDFQNYLLEWRGGLAELAAIGPFVREGEPDPGSEGPPDSMEVVAVEVVG